MSTLTTALGGTAAIAGTIGGIVPPPFGTALQLGGAALGLVGNIIGENEVDKAMDDAMNLQKDQQKESKVKERAADTKHRTIQGETFRSNSTQSQWFKFGNNGATGFQLEPKQIMTQHSPITSDGYVIQGPSHEEGSVEDANGNKAEGGEVVYKEMVYSARAASKSGLTFAKEAENVLGEMASLQTEDKEIRDKHRQNSIKRELEIVDMRLHRLFQEQSQIQ